MDQTSTGAHTEGTRTPTWRSVAHLVVQNLPGLARDYAYAVTQMLRAAGHRWVRSPRQEGQTTVFVLPGIWEQSGFMTPLLQALRAAGYDVRTVDSVRENLREPELMAAKVRRELEQEDLRDVVLVAHSKGGLVAKHLLSDARATGRILGAVCIATPFSGSWWSRLFIPGLGIRELSATGPIILALAQHTEVNGRITSIYPTKDQHVPEGSYLQGAVNVPIEAVGHNQILADPRFIKAALEGVRGYVEGARRRPQHGVEDGPGAPDGDKIRQ